MKPRHCAYCGKRLEEHTWSRKTNKTYCCMEHMMNHKKGIPYVPPEVEELSAWEEYHEEWAKVREAINKQKNRLGKAGGIGPVQAKISEQLRRVDEEEIKQKYVVGGDAWP